MANHVTSVIEFREAGLLLKSRETHVIRVLGALKQVHFSSVPNGKENMASRATESIYDQYYSGSLTGPQMDPAAGPFNPRVPTLFITRKGEALFLKRDLS
jgi:hypothetical protein